MKKFLAAVAFLLIFTAVTTPTLAQKSKEASREVKGNRISVKYAELNAFSDGRGVWLEWKTSVETKNIGFYVYRVIGGEKQLVSSEFIPGAYLQASAEQITSGNYSFYDQDGDFNSSYIIESFNVSGVRQSSEIIEPKQVSDLTPVAGLSSEQLLEQARSARPVVSGNNSILPKDLKAEVASYTLPADPVMQRWVAAQPGVKIGVKNEGFYRVSRTELQNGGFNVNAPVEQWQLYANGVEQAINVAANGDYIEFYGKGVDTLYADTQIYFLLVGANNGKRISSVVRRRIGSSVASNSYSQSFFKKERSIYVPGFLNGDEENYYGTLVFPSGGNINFNLSGVDFSTSTASIDLTMHGLTEIDHATKVFINNTEVGNLNGGPTALTSGRYTFPTSILVEGANQLRLVAIGGNPQTTDISLFTSMKINFARRYQADQNRLSFYVPNYKNVYAEKFATPNVRVFDMTNSDAPVLVSGLNIEAINGSFRVNIPSNRGRVLYALEDSGISTAASIIQNIPSTLSTNVRNGEMIIVSHKNFLTQANTWADYRRARGISVEVTDIEDIYDEFNYGIKCADCIRDFLNYAKTNWQTAPKYTMFIGDSTYDPKNYKGANADFVPSRLADTVYTEISSDDTLADFNNDGLAEVAVGRIPARDAATVTLVFNKMTLFEQTVTQAPPRGAFFASDVPNGYDFEGSSQRLCNQLPSTIGCTKVNRAEANASANLMAQINQGKYLVNYSGHGNASAWENTGFFGNALANQLNNGNNLSIFTMLSCLNGYFTDPLNESLSEVLLKNPNGGAVTTWASAGLTTPDIQEIMATRFYGQIGAGNITRIGDLVNDAKTTIDFGRDVRISWVLLGDPAMKVR